MGAIDGGSGVLCSNAERGWGSLCVEEVSEAGDGQEDVWWRRANYCPSHW